MSGIVCVLNYLTVPCTFILDAYITLKQPIEVNKNLGNYFTRKGFIVLKFNVLRFLFVMHGIESAKGLLISC